MLWYAMRAVDVAGKGYADVDLNAMALSMGRSKVTLKRYLRQGMTEAVYQAEQKCLLKKAKAAQGADLEVEQPWGECLPSNKLTPEEQAEKSKVEASKRLNFFRGVTSLGNGKYRIYYSSLFAVCMHLGLDHWGAVTEIKVSELRHMKAIATEASIVRLQRRSEYQANRQHKRGVPTPEAILAPSVSTLGVKGRVLKRGKRVTYVDQDFVLIGTKQTTIAKSLGRSDRTVRRRISNKVRDRKQLPKIERRQIAQLVGNAQTYCNAGWGRNLHSDRVFNVKGKLFEFHCNVYAETRELVPMKMRRKMFAREEAAKAAERLAFIENAATTPYR